MSLLRLNDAKRRNFNQTTAVVCRGGIYTGRHSVWIRSNKKSANMKLTSFQFCPVAACGTAADRESQPPKNTFSRWTTVIKDVCKRFFWSIKVLYLWTFPWAQKNSFKICKQETLAYIFKGAAQPGSKPERKKPFTAIMSINQSINLSKLYCRLAAPTNVVQQR